MLTFAVAGFSPKDPARYDIPRSYSDARCDAPTASTPGGEFYPLLMKVFPGLDDMIVEAEQVSVYPLCLGGLGFEVWEPV